MKKSKTMKTPGKVKGIYLANPLWSWLAREAHKDKRSLSKFMAILADTEKSRREKRIKKRLP